MPDVEKDEDRFMVFTKRRLNEYFNKLDTKAKRRELTIFRRIVLNVQGERHYIVCNQDEPYAKKVWMVILEGEAEKIAAIPANKKTCGTCEAFGNQEESVHEGECMDVVVEGFHPWLPAGKEGCIDWRPRK